MTFDPLQSASANAARYIPGAKDKINPNITAQEIRGSVPTPKPILQFHDSSEQSQVDDDVESLCLCDDTHREEKSNTLEASYDLDAPRRIAEIHRETVMQAQRGVESLQEAAQDIKLCGLPEKSLIALAEEVPAISLTQANTQLICLALIVKKELSDLKSLDLNWNQHGVTFVQTLFELSKTEEKDKMITECVRFQYSLAQRLNKNIYLNSNYQSQYQTLTSINKALLGKHQNPIVSYPNDRLEYHLSSVALSLKLLCVIENQQLFHFQLSTKVIHRCLSQTLSCSQIYALPEKCLPDWYALADSEDPELELCRSQCIQIITDVNQLRYEGDEIDNTMLHFAESLWLIFIACRDYNLSYKNNYNASLIKEVVISHRLKEALFSFHSSNCDFRSFILDEKTIRFGENIEFRPNLSKNKNFDNLYCELIELLQKQGITFNDKSNIDHISIGNWQLKMFLDDDNIRFHCTPYHPQQTFEVNINQTEKKPSTYELLDKTAFKLQQKETLGFESGHKHIDAVSTFNGNPEYFLRFLLYFHHATFLATTLDRFDSLGYFLYCDDENRDEFNRYIQYLNSEIKRGALPRAGNYKAIVQLKELLQFISIDNYEYRATNLAHLKDEKHTCGIDKEARTTIELRMFHTPRSGAEVRVINKFIIGILRLSLEDLKNREPLKLFGKSPDFYDKNPGQAEYEMAKLCRQIGLTHDEYRLIMRIPVSEHSYGADCYDSAEADF